ncbi:TusE/DsrC/DsvC family sulfur relay protein [Thermopetrobacter sp. TC1]|uniref:TusE/DsrC/DsvC family sulfur relay protein n=1 Tax=Thermopetrobacter sp. TC1 TaxID=1495045 RepID=UPI0018CF03AA|nr:TusE/DsrC/DsvC family sulfur relay protein [Thermopetrobacter sp. TC1]
MSEPALKEITLPPRDGDGFLENMNDWTPEIGRAMAEADGFPLTDEMWEQIMLARQYYQEHGTTPPLRKFMKYAGKSKKELFDLWQTGPMKAIAKYGGLPKPTGCV